MNYGLNSGDLFITTGDETTLFANGISFTEEVEMNASENPTHMYHFDNAPSVNYEVSGANLALLDDYCNTIMPNGKFTIEADINIMIQARWHKKKRVNKKWLKRYGMKPDTVRMKANAAAGEYHTDDGSLDFKSDAIEYLWRPDQKRKNLKIEM